MYKRQVSGELKQATLAEFADAVALYRDQKFSEALAGFDAIVAANPHDGPADLYIQRCRKLLNDGWNREDWDSVTTIETK